MKASEHGGNTPSILGSVGYSKHEDGDSDGVWSNAAKLEADAIDELGADDDDPKGDGDDIIGYIGDLTEVDVPVISTDDILSNINENMCSDAPSELVDNWPVATCQQSHELETEINAVFAKWLTKYKLWPTWCDIDNIRPVLRKQARSQEGA